MKRILVLGASGSIGANAIQIIKDYPDYFSLVGAQAHKSIDFLIKLKQVFPKIKTATTIMANNIDDGIDFYGIHAIEQLIEKTKPDIIVNGISGSAGLMPSVIALRNGISLALANKESIVMAGNLLFNLAKKKNLSIIPVDSEHAALFQLLRYMDKKNVAELILTASGGPFFKKSRLELMGVTADQALAHPTWKMGGKISIDSATLANKGLELIEAMYLFNFDESLIKVLVHPESQVHSLIRLCNATMYAQISKPDMRQSIHEALCFPQIPQSNYSYLDLAGKTLSFEQVDNETFPMLNLARECAQKKGIFPLIYNAANEVAVDLFLKGAISFLNISQLVEKVLSNNNPHGPANEFEELMQLNTEYKELSYTVSKEFRL